MSFLSQISEYDAEARPERGEGWAARRPGTNTLPVGDYECLILDAEGRETPKSHEAILTVGLRVLAPAHLAGEEVEHTWFLNAPEDVNRCWADLVSLGCGSSGKFSAQVEAWLNRAAGVRFLASTTAKTNGGVFFNVRGKVLGNAAASGHPTLDRAAAAILARASAGPEREQQTVTADDVGEIVWGD